MKPTIALFLHDPKCSVQSGNGLMRALGDHYKFKIFGKNKLEDEDVDEIIKSSTKHQQKKRNDNDVIGEIEAQVKKYKEMAGITKPDHRVTSRHVESMRLALVKQFNARISAATKCKDCKGGWDKIVFYKSKIVYVLKKDTLITNIGYVEILACYKE